MSWGAEEVEGFADLGFGGCGDVVCFCERGLARGLGGGGGRGRAPFGGLWGVVRWMVKGGFGGRRGDCTMGIVGGLFWGWLGLMEWLGNERYG